MNEFVTRNGLLSLDDSTISGSLVVTRGVTGSLQGTASQAVNSTNAATASSADNFTVRNTLTAQTLVVQTVTSSIVYSSGSNIFGNSLSNTQSMTGSVSVTGSLSVNGSPVILTNQTSSTMFVQGGNSFGTQALLGTNDNQNLALETGGTIRMTINTSGNVGIGTASPAYITHIVGGNGNQFAIDNTGQAFTQQYWRINGSNVGSIWVSSTEMSMYTYGTQPIIFHTNTAERMRITSAGNVGIGTASPTELLHVAGNGRFNGYVSLNNQGYIRGGTNTLDLQGGTIGTYFYNSSYSAVRMVVLDGGNVGIGTTSPLQKFSVAANATEGVGIQDQSGYGSIVYKHLSTGAFRDGMIDASNLLLQTQSSGNVGIGTTSPSRLLDVNGLARFNSSGNWMEFNINVLTSLSDDGAHIRSVISDATVPTYAFKGDQDTGMWTPGANILSFATGGSERIRITSGGNVLIGTTSDNGQRLQVNGNVWIRGEGSGDAIIGSAVFGSGNYTGISLNGTLSTSRYNILSSPTDISLYINRNSGGKIAFREGNGNDQVTIASGGNVGIGTMSPAARLDVAFENSFNQNTPGLSPYGIYLSGQSTNNSATGITFSAGSATPGTAQAGIYSQGSGAYGTRLYLATTNNYSTGAITRLMINENGLVGIGTTSPVTRLTVNGGASNTGTNFQIKNYSVVGGFAGGYTGGTIQSMLAGYDGASIYGTDIGYAYDGIGYELVFSTNDDVSGNPIERLRIGRTGAATFSGALSGTSATFSGDIIVNKSSGDAFLRLNNPNATTSYIRLDDNNTIRGYFGMNGLTGGSNADLAIYSNTGGIRFFANSTERLTITSAGNVGIGTTSPSVALDIRVNSGILVGANSRTVVRQTVGGDAEIGAASGGDLYLLNRGSTALSFNSLGAYFTNTVRSTNVQTAIQANGGFYGNSGGDYHTMGYNVGFTSTSGQWNYVFTDLASFIRFNVGGFQFWTAGGGSSGTAMSPSLRYTLDVNGNNTWTGNGSFGGNVGIGTTSPIAPLHVNSTAQNIGVYIGDSSNVRSPTLAFGVSGGFNTFIQQSNANSSLNFLVNNGNTTALTILSSGNVGIGTTSPATDLQIVRAGSLTMRLSNTSTNVDTEIGVSGGLGFVGTKSTTPFGIVTGDTERIRITSVGNVGIGVTSPIYTLQLATDSAGKPNGGSWANSSDIRLKENIRTIDNALDKLSALRGVLFDWKNPIDQDNIKSSGGFIADEVMKVFPDWVTEIEPSEIQKAFVQGDKVKSLSLPFVFDALVVESIKELKKQVEELNARIKELESK